MKKSFCKCGNEIIAIRRTKRFCDDCAAIQRRANGQRHRVKIGIASTPRKIKCACCGEGVTVPTKRHKYCENCSARFEGAGSSIHYHLRKKGASSRRGETISCNECGAAMAKRAAAHRFCSLTCRSAHQKREAAKPINRINNRMRAGIWATVKGLKSGRRWQELVGYSAQELKTHLERQFVAGMSWDNFGEWHIDHRQPLASFHFGSPDEPEFKAAWALSNLQPLWADDNIRKHANITCLV